MRRIRQGPDGLLYVLVDDDDGAILRIEPPSKPAKGLENGYPLASSQVFTYDFGRPSIASNESAWHGAWCSCSERYLGR